MGVIVYKCLNCGGPLEFKAESQKWECEYCLSNFSAGDMKRFEDEQKLQAVVEMDTETFEKEKGLEIEFAEKAKSYSCKSCGAEIVTEETTAATFCYYCHNPTIIPGQLSGDYRPAQVIPFQITKEQAEESFVQWCNKKPLLSKYFTLPSQLEKLSGIYVPFWLFDCDTIGSIDAEATKSRSYTRGNMRYTETKYYRVIREGKADYRKVPADGSTKMDEKLMGGLEPYDYADLKDFSMSYLSGYLAEKYDLNQNDVYGRISDVIRQHTSSLLRQTMKGYGSVSIKDSSFNIKKVDATYVLLPVWMFTYQYKGKTYVFAMNGQTGKISGNLPISMKRAAAWFGIVTGASFLTMLIGGWLL